MRYISVYKPQGQSWYSNIGQPKGNKYSLKKVIITQKW